MDRLRPILAIFSPDIGISNDLDPTPGATRPAGKRLRHVRERAARLLNRAVEVIECRAA
jgi:hypothetical protein